MGDSHGRSSRGVRELAARNGVRNANVDNAYAAMLIRAALNRELLPHY